MAVKAPITVASVVAMADRQRLQADRLMRIDPYVRPPYPTTAAAKMLCSRKKAARAAALPADASDEDRKKACELAPADAQAELEWRWARFEGEYRRGKEDDEHRHKRHVRRQLHAKRDREAALNGKTLGQRIDQALASLSAIPAPRSSTLEPRVSRSAEQALPTPPGDPAEKARLIAMEAVQKLEDEVQTARRRRVEKEGRAA